jgi:hypothetical protein
MAQNHSYVPPAATVEPRVHGNHEGESTGSLLRRLGEDLTTLLRKELALATTEVSRAIAEAKQGLVSVAAGGAVLFMGALILLLAITAALAEAMDPWLAGLIVGGIVTIVGYMMLTRGKKKLDPAGLKPERTQEALRDNRELLHRRPQ